MPKFSPGVLDPLDDVFAILQLAGPDPATDVPEEVALAGGVVGADEAADQLFVGYI